MYRPKIYEPKDTILALSVNFILNEHYFWGNEQLDETAYKHWKMLQNYSNIAWICQKSASVQKLLKFSKNNNLRLDAVYLILPKKNKRSITVNYSPI